MMKGKRHLIFTPAFRILSGLVISTLFVSVGLSFILLNERNHDFPLFSSRDTTSKYDIGLAHLEPRLPHLPPFPFIKHADILIADTLENKKPTITGIVAVLDRFVSLLRESNIRFSTAAHSSPRDIHAADVRAAYYSLVSKHLVPLDQALKEAKFPRIRNDDSLFLSVAAFREHVLADTLKSAFRYASNPDKLFIGAVVQNCFGNQTSYQSESCKTGWQVVGDKKKKRKNQPRKILDAPPDRNGIEEFCSDRNFTKYCDAGQLRVLYIHETEALGPAVARYFTSKLWGGETYYCQVDSHLQFARNWDKLYIENLQRAKSYPKAVLSTYPPGFVNFRQEEPFTPGNRICNCHFSKGEGNILRIEMNGRCREGEPRPTQMPFMGAGFFFARSNLLEDVPFDPYLPWCFMGEEIAFSMRAWTNGYNIYAPSINLIGHHYRPLSLGLPHYWETVTRLFPKLSDQLMAQSRKRIKHLVEYPTHTSEVMEKEWFKELDHRSSHQADVQSLGKDDYNILMDLKSYGLGSLRSAREYHKFAEIDFESETCGKLTWCSNGELE